MQASNPGSQAAPASRSAGGNLSTYVATWVLLAASGLAYLGVVAARPDLVGAVSGDSVASGSHAADLSEQLAQARSWARDLEVELGEARRQLSAERERLAQIEVDMVGAEIKRSRLAQAPEAGAASTGPADKSGRPGYELPLPPSIAEALHSGDATGSGAAGVRIVNSAPAAPKASPIVTGAIEGAKDRAAPAATGSGAAAVAFGAPKVVAAVPSSGIEIGAAESLDGLRESWATIANGNVDVLRRAAPRYRISADGRAKPFTLIAGPFATPAEASKACASLRARGVPCRVSEFSGSVM